MLQCAQIGLNTSDIPASLRLYHEAFGFLNAGGNVFWGDTIRVQGLDTDARTLMWWLVGDQKFFQLEFFHHTQPAQKLRPAGWRPCDCGWVRFGVEVGDFDKSQKALTRWKIPALGPVQGGPGKRRMAFYDPFVGVIVEVIEGKEAGSPPSVPYVTSSVSNLASARAFYTNTMGLQVDDLATLHAPEHEALWGLAGADRDGFVVRSGATLLEIVEYKNPRGKPRPSDYKISDQGIMNVALASRQRADIEGALDRLKAAGLPSPHVLDGGGILVGYVTAPERELEIGFLPEELDAALGFHTIGPFIT